MGFVSIHTSYVHYVTFNTYELRALRHLAYCGFVSIPTCYVHYVTLKILWFCQYTYELRALHQFLHTVVFSVYLPGTCTTSLLTYCGFVSIPTSYVHYVIFNILWFVSIPTSYVHYVTFNILWFCQYTNLRVTCTTSLLTYCGCVSIITSYVHYVTFKILWFCQYTYELRVLRHF